MQPLPTGKDIVAYLLVNLWEVTEEHIGCPFLVGQLMRVGYASGIGPFAKRLVISPAKVSQSDERFNGTFTSIKPFVRQYLNSDTPHISCSGGIILKVHHVQDRIDPDLRSRPNG